MELLAVHADLCTVCQWDKHLPGQEDGATTSSCKFYDNELGPAQPQLVKYELGPAQSLLVKYIMSSRVSSWEARGLPRPGQLR